MSDETKDAETPFRKLIDFKDGLRIALEKEIAGTDRMAVNHFFAFGRGRETPPECAGNRDRSNGFYWATTILKAFGEKEGVAYLLRLHPYHPELETGVQVVFNKSLKEIDKAAAERFAKSRLVTACTATSAAIKEVLAYEADHVLQHSLTSLQGELAWCARELNPEGRHET